MTKELSIRVPLNVNKILYSSLLQEAGTARAIPKLIREKLEASYLSKDDARRLLAQQELTNLMIIDIMKMLALPLTVASEQMQSDQSKMEALKTRLEELRNKQLDKIERFRKEVGL